MKSLLDLIKALYGPKAISSTIGTRTNVIRLPSGKLQRYLKEGLNIEAASDNAAQNAYNEMKELIPEVAKMNDAERLIFEGNLRRLKNKLEASGLIQGENVTSGITAIESKAEQLKQAGKELEEITKPKSIIGDIMKDYSSFQKIMQEERRKGLVRATTRSILYQDIKAGKIKNMTLEDLGSVRDPINNFREIYGEGALEQLDSLADNFAQMTTAEEAATFAKTKFKFEPRTNTLPETTTIEEGRKAEQEFGINKPAKVSDFKAEATKRTSIDDLIDEYNANQDRLLLTDDEGGTLITYPEYNKLKDRNDEIAKALEAKGISSKVEEAPQAEIIQFRKKPTEPEGKADGGRIGYAQGTPAMGLDYLTGMGPSKGYADGGRIGFKTGGGKKILDLINKANKELKSKSSMEKVNPKTGEVTIPKEPVKTAENKSRQLTNDEIADYEEQIGRNAEEWLSEGTVDEAEKALKRSKAEEAYYLQQYKTGQLDPKPGEKSQSRMRFLQKKAEEAELTGDRRLFSLDELDELDELERTFNKKNTSAGGFDFNDTDIKAQMEKAMQEGNKRSKEMRAMGLDPAKSKDYDEYIKIKEASGDKNFNKYFDDLEIKTKFKGVISDDLLNQILIDDNPQRKAEVIATIEQGLTMQEKGMSPEQIVDILKNTTRTKQAKGGSIGLNYLMGL
jgi:hypothetical protein